VTVRQTVPLDAGVSNASGSCVNGDRFTPAARPEPEPSPPQALCRSDERSARCATCLAAFRSRPQTRPHRPPHHVRCAQGRVASRQPHAQPVLDVGSQRLAPSTWQPVPFTASSTTTGGVCARREVRCCSVVVRWVAAWWSAGWRPSGAGLPSGERPSGGCDSWCADARPCAGRG
jgi:hypothetical protein